MRDASTRPSRRNKSLGRKVVEWTFGLLAAAVILAGVGLLGARFFFPKLGAEIRETTVAIDSIIPASEAPTGVDTPIVTIEDRETWLQIPPTVPAELAEGMNVHVTYEWIPTTRSVRVQSWGASDTPSGHSGEVSEAPDSDPTS